jgi:hypothetical protein
MADDVVLDDLDADNTAMNDLHRSLFTVVGYQEWSYGVTGPWLPALPNRSASRALAVAGARTVSSSAAEVTCRVKSKNEQQSCSAAASAATSAAKSGVAGKSAPHRPRCPAER